MPVPPLIGYTDPARYGFPRQLSQCIASLAVGVSQLTIIGIQDSHLSVGSESSLVLWFIFWFPRLWYGSDLAGLLDMI